MQVLHLRLLVKPPSLPLGQFPHGGAQHRLVLEPKVRLVDAEFALTLSLHDWPMSRVITPIALPQLFWLPSPKTYRSVSRGGDHYGPGPVEPQKRLP
jgi:hypothetical protein